MSNVHICSPRPVVKEVHYNECPTTKTVEPMLCTLYEWYGWSVTCLQCGEHWNDGERSDRPFARGWRKLSVARALAKLHDAKVVSVAEAQR